MPTVLFRGIGHRDRWACRSMSRSSLARRPPQHRRARQRGAALLEVLISMVVSVIGLLGLIGLQARSYQAESEAYQRAHALVLLDDLSSRLKSNYANAGAYVVDDLGEGSLLDCSTAASPAARDLCEVGNTLRGAAEMAGGSATGAMTRARACITNPVPGTYRIAIVWMGVVPTGAPVTTCGQGDYGDEGLRRAVSTVIVVPDLAA